MMDSLPFEDISLWRRSGTDVYGKPLFSTGEPIRGYWAETVAEVTDTQNRKVTSTASVDTDALPPPAPGDMLARGLLYDFPDAVRLDPRSGDGVAVALRVDATYPLTDGVPWAVIYL